jgi:predicted DNA-binding transcriptional regulator YafY
MRRVLRMMPEILAEDIEAAIRAEDVLVFSYPSSEDGQPKERVLSPWMLERDDEIVKGWDHDHERVRRYEIARMSTVYVDLACEWVRPA